MTQPMVSVIVVAYRQTDALARCLESAGAAVADVAGELIVVDNGSLSELVRGRFPDAQLVTPGFNSGFAGGVARGLAAARGRWVALINDDATIEPDALALMLAAGERSESIGAVATQVRFSDARDRVNSAGIHVDRLGVATERLAGAPVAAASEPGEVFGASACCGLYRRAMLDEIGGFDERFFAYLEDVDVAWRARAAGWSCVYEPRAIAYHQGSASSRHGSAKKYFLVGRNRVWLLARNATTLQLLSAWPAIARLRLRVYRLCRGDGSHTRAAQGPDGRDADVAARTPRAARAPAGGPARSPELQGVAAPAPCLSRARLASACSTASAIRAAGAG